MAKRARLYSEPSAVAASVFAQRAASVRGEGAARLVLSGHLFLARGLSHRGPTEVHGT